ncbi:MAG: GWxTD domain-containing protein [Gemmatimonadota bacterium]|nr:MAG: GWxTD domain-containing protein [Gemmatimonadota bacterium]
MRHVTTLLLSAWLVVAAHAAQAQEDLARQHIERGLAYASAGDTLLAFAEFERATDAAPSLADAYYHLGRLYSHRASSVETEFRDRLTAERALLEALRLNPSDPRYLLELARLRLKQHMKVDAGRLFGRALSLAEEQGDPDVLAEIHFNIGYIRELEYESQRHRRFRPFFRGPPVTEFYRLFDVRPSRYVEGYLEDAPPIEDSGEVAKEEMLEHYRAALRNDPKHVGAAIRLMGYLFDELRLAEYLNLARKLQAEHPERPEPYLFLGLGLHAAGREDEAAEAFDDGLARLPDDERAAIENLAPVMRRQAAEDYLDLSEEGRAEFNARYWQLTDPLYLTDANERRLEHIARVAYADLRFAGPEVGLRGWETDRGTVFVRYGPPDDIGVFGPDVSSRGNPYAIGRRSIIWSYGRDGPVFIFQQMPGYLNARFAGDYKFIAEEYRALMPAKYDNIPSIPELLELPVQIARFRGETPDEVAVEIHAALPLVGLARDLDLDQGELEVGLFLFNRYGESFLRRVGTEVVTYAESAEANEYRSWRILMPPADFLVAAVETRDAVTWRAAAARDTFTVSAFASDSLSVSDILVADAIRPLVEDPQKRFDYDIQVNPALEFLPGESVHIYYELYGLASDPEGFASYDVALQVRVKRLHRGGPIGQLLGALADAWGFSIVGDDRLELRFSREVRLDGRDRVTEYLALDPKEVPAGEYEIRLRIWDRLGEQLVSRERAFQVIEKE